MKENYLVCKCKKVSYADIEDALYKHESFHDVIEAFEDIKSETKCSTGCGGCHDKVMAIISDFMMGASSHTENT